MPRANKHKRTQTTTNDHKRPANNHIPQANDRKPQRNDYKIPGKEH